MAYEGQQTHRNPRRDRLNHEQRILLTALLGGLPGSLISLILLWDRPYTPKVQWTLTLLICGFWLGFAFSLRGRVVRHLQTLSNLLAALREGDYSIRARGAGREDALGDVMLEVNALGETLRAQRLGAMEATALLRTVMGEIDVAVFAFDEEERLRLVNRAGERLFAQPSVRLLGRTAVELGLEEFLHFSREDDSQIIPKAFPGRMGRWGVRRSVFREHGLPHQLLVLSDLSRELREEEREAWKRLVRVLGHELNNSLTPIKSIAGSLESLLVREPRPLDWHDDMRRGLSIIGSRSESLSRFMQAYARLARLPPPRFAPVNVGALVRRVAELETRLPVRVLPGAELVVQADVDQLEQLLINLQRNAVDASLETGGGVNVSWIKNTNHFTLSIEDEGPGLSNTTNLFVPFFTTKPGGSGIGLVLSRQIAEAHGGTLTLTNRRRGTGCEARLQLPL
jgi:nitrogen fixation/metabolism regulation signal transduction histidine kinase